MLLKIMDKSKFIIVDDLVFVVTVKHINDINCCYSKI